MYHHPQNLTVYSQLLMTADTISIGSNQTYVLRTVLHDITCSQFCGSGGFTYAGWTDQGKYTALVQDFGFGFDGVQVDGKDILNPGGGFINIQISRHFFR